MKREEFFKEVLVLLFGIFSKNESQIKWKNRDSSFVVEMENNTFDCYIRIYDNKVIVISSKDRYKYWNSDFNISAFKEYFTKMFNDNDPF